MDNEMVWPAQGDRLFVEGGLYETSAYIMPTNVLTDISIAEDPRPQMCILVRPDTPHCADSPNCRTRRTNTMAIRLKILPRSRVICLSALSLATSRIDGTRIASKGLRGRFVSWRCQQFGSRI
jgi:hypothetical protein